MSEGSEFREVRAEVVRPLRTEVLRPGFSDGESLTFDADEEESTLHFALLRVDESGGESGEPIAVLTWFVDEPPEAVRAAAGATPVPSYRLRGMAVAEPLRREGLGARLLQGSLVRLALYAPRCEVVWCNARTSAVGFYQREGFDAVGEPFDIDGIGPHRVMWRRPPTVLADDQSEWSEVTG